QRGVHGGRNVARIAGRAHHKRHGAAVSDRGTREVRVRKEDLRPRLRLGAVRSRVADDSHDRNPRKLTKKLLRYMAHTAADRALAGPVAARGFFVDHGYPWTAGDVRRVDEAAFEQRHTHRLE